MVVASRFQWLMIGIGSAVLGLLSSPALLPLQPAAAAGCGDPNAALQTEQMLQILIVRERDTIRETFGICEEPCDGGLYLVDPSDMQKLIRINESWWLDEFDSADLIDATSGDGIVVRASYITGIGPTGTIPFRAEITLKRDSNSWTALEPVTFEPDKSSQSKTSVTAGPGQAITKQAQNAEEYGQLQVTERGQPFAVDINFDTDRFIIGSVVLTSSSATITDLRVQKADDSYFVSYKVKSPRIGITDMKQSLIYTVLPNDGLPVNFLQRPNRNIRGKIVTVEVGVIDRGGFAGAPK